MSLPDIHAPERGNTQTVVDESIGKVLIGGQLFTAEDANNFGHDIIQAAQFAAKQGTIEIDMLPRDGIVLAKSPGSGWVGTFSLTVKHLLADLLSDEASIEINLQAYNPEGEKVTSTVNGVLVLIDEGDDVLIFQDGFRVQISDIEAVQVPA